MLFNNNVIKENNTISFLICKNKMINFYKKFFWKKIDNSKFSIMDHPFNTNGMLFNDSKKLRSAKNPLKIYM